MSYTDPKWSNLESAITKAELRLYTKAIREVGDTVKATSLIKTNSGRSTYEGVRDPLSGVARSFVRSDVRITGSSNLYCCYLNASKYAQDIHASFLIYTAVLGQSTIQSCDLRRSLVTGGTRLLSVESDQVDECRIDGHITLNGVKLRGSPVFVAKETLTIAGPYRFGGCALIRSDLDYMAIGPSVSSGRFLTAHKDTAMGLRLNTGCWSGSLKDFVRAVDLTHGNNVAGRQYTDWAELIRKTAIERGWVRER